MNTGEFNKEQKNQYDKTLLCYRLEEDTDERNEILNNISNTQLKKVVAAYDVGLRETYPDVLGVVDVLQGMKEDGKIDLDEEEYDNDYRSIAIEVIDIVEEILEDILIGPNTEDEDIPEDASKIYGELYYTLEDNIIEILRQNI